MTSNERQGSSSSGLNSGLRAVRAAGRAFGLIAASALCLTALPGLARAAVPGDRVDFTGYGRMGVAWSLSGQNIQGQYMNLTDHGIGGRFEEGDYVEPTMKLHLVKPDKDKPDDPYVDVGLTTAMYNRSGSLMSLVAANTPTDTLAIELLQAYVEGGNVFVPGLKFWGGARQYRGTDVHIADYFYFNDLTGQGGGLMYKGLELATLQYTAGDSSYPGYNFNSVGHTGAPDVQRNRTVFVAQYKYEFGKHFLLGLGEVHVVPQARLALHTPLLAKGDHGEVLGAKLHLDLDRGQFNDFSVRIGTRIADGAWGGRKTWQTFGPPGADGKYDGAYGLELVEHFLVNFGTIASLNGYGILHYNKAPDSGKGGFLRDNLGQIVSPDRILDWAVGARSLIYVHKNFHMVNELTYQGRKDGDRAMGTAVKFSVVPTIVPTGEMTAWARPHLRLIYTVGVYNQAAVDQQLSPYLRATGANSKFAQYIGARSEWWY